MKVVVTGGTGFVGRALVRALAARGDTVVVLSRHPESAVLVEGAEAAAWDLDDSSWYGIIDGVDAVVHLAGEQAVGVRWNDAVKERLMHSRVRGAERLVEAIWRAKKKPSVFLSASGVGYYGPRGDAPVDESGKAGGDFLAEVCVKWEAAARKAEDVGVRVVRARLGVVFGKGGGALAEMATPFKLFVGGPIGSGRQVMSWVHLDDAVGVLIRCLDDGAVRGAVNVTAPEAVTNAELAKVLGSVLHRPSFFRVPESALRIRFGEGADPLLTGQRAVPKVLLDLGYAYRFTDVRAALEDAIG